MDVTREELEGRLGEEGLVVVDVRTRLEYTGELGAPCDPRQGHIAGAQHLDLAELVGLTVDEVRERVGAPEGAEVVAYCHSGQRSAYAVEVLRMAGYEARNYPGSWHEWSRDPALPAETSQADA
jgi:thiosulfate/3-mercaptopyruvate sulfurtransferase